ncbi:MAG: hypothetical protein NC211_03945 [Alistipes senegalensis]|nr:hypothetical protein [Oxalobacter formigenes]MCM1280969.1 hypothetical protein [Alistipes senegalensis]
MDIENSPPQRQVGCGKKKIKNFTRVFSILQDFHWLRAKDHLKRNGCFAFYGMNIYDTVKMYSLSVPYFPV